MNGQAILNLSTKPDFVFKEYITLKQGLWMKIRKRYHSIER